MSVHCEQLVLTIQCMFGSNKRYQPSKKSIHVFLSEGIARAQKYKLGIFNFDAPLTDSFAWLLG
jgi:hypothetical protein